MKILIVEAQLDLQKKLTNFFSNNHYQIIVTDNGKKAIEILKNKTQEIDFILCDFDYPTENCKDLIKFIQDSQKIIPFVFMTTPEKIYSVIHKLKKGIWNYITKPILNFEILLITVEQLAHQNSLMMANSLFKKQLALKHQELEQDHLAGNKLQQQLLPQNNVNILDLNFNYFLHPSLYVSGDFVDYQQLSDRYAIFYLSDVSGHGVSSAFVNVLVKACISQYCSEYTHMDNHTVIDPKEMLATINNVVCRESLGKYLTMIYMVYDKKFSKITYSVAGHFPFPIYQTGNMKAKYIGERGYPVGMFKEATYQNYEFDLVDNFKLALFSDGIMEIIKSDKLIDKEQSVLELITELGNYDLKFVEEKLSIESGVEFPDDITGLIVRRIGINN